MKNKNNILGSIIVLILIFAAVAAVIVYKEKIMDAISELKFRLSERRCNCICIDDRDDFEN